MNKIAKLTTFICFVALVQTTCCLAQTVHPDSTAAKPDYCKLDSAAAFGLIGTNAKIDREGGVYSTLNQTESLKWPSAEMKKLGGRSGWKKYKPAKGDSGKIVHVFIDNGSTSKYIFLLQVNDKYVPVGCNYLLEQVAQKM